MTQAFVTDIGKRRCHGGAGVELYREIIAAVPELDLIASGGVSSIEDIEKLEHIGCSA